MMSMVVGRLVRSNPFVGSPKYVLNVAKQLSNDASSMGSNLKLSENCVKRLKEVAGPKEHLRVTVESGGCSGFQYNFSLDSQLSDDDAIFEEQGVRVVIDNTSLTFLEGATIDYHSELIRSSFRVVNNTKAEAGCSCGVSFSVKI